MGDVMANTRLDLNGKRFGNLRVIRYDELGSKGKRSSKWIVQCDCGSPAKSVYGASLNDGETVTCGKDCTLREQQRKGRQYNNLTAVQMLAREGQKQLWEWRCVCGNSVLALWKYVLKGGVTQCAECVKKERSARIRTRNKQPRPNLNNTIDMTDRIQQ